MKTKNPESLLINQNLGTIEEAWKIIQHDKGHTCSACGAPEYCKDCKLCENCGHTED